MLRQLLVCVGLLGCGRIAFDGEQGFAVDLVPDTTLPRGGLAIAPQPDGSGFAVAWSEFAPDSAIATWRFGVVDNAGDWAQSPVELFQDAEEELLSVQLVRSGGQWLLARRHDYHLARAPLAVALISDTGAVVRKFEYTGNWFGAAKVVPHSTGFLVTYHHHVTLSDGNGWRQVVVRTYDLAGNALTSEAIVDERLDSQLLLAATEQDGTGAFVIWREDLGTARFAVLDATGTATVGGTIAQVTDPYWAPEIQRAGGRVVFVRMTTAGVAVHRIESDGTASWTPFEYEIPLGTNRFAPRRWSVAGDDTQLYLAWRSDVETDVPSIQLATIDATGTVLALTLLASATDGSSLDFNPNLAVSPSHIALAYIHERDGARRLMFEVRPR